MTSSRLLPSRAEASRAATSSSSSGWWTSSVAAGGANRRCSPATRGLLASLPRRCRRGRGVRLVSRAVDLGGSSSSSTLGASSTSDGSSSEKHKEGMDAYAELKSQISGNTLAAGALLSAYFFLVWSTEAALGSALGSAGSYFYVRLLIAEVDALHLDYVPYVCLPMERIRKKLPPEKTFSLAEREANEYLRAKIQLSGPFKQGLLKRRLAIPVAIGAAASLLNHLVLLPEGSPKAEFLPYAAVLFGFFSYKAALVVQIWNQVKIMLVPQFDVEEFLRKYED